MSAANHRPTDWGGGGVNCIQDHEPWPCRVTRIRREVIKETVAELAEVIRPSGPEPKCCDDHFRAWELRQDIANEYLRDWLEEKLKKIDTLTRES